MDIKVTIIDTEVCDSKYPFLWVVYVDGEELCSDYEETQEMAVIASTKYIRTIYA